MWSREPDPAPHLFWRSFYSEEDLDNEFSCEWWGLNICGYDRLTEEQQDELTTSAWNFGGSSTGSYFYFDTEKHRDLFYLRWSHLDGKEYVECLSP